jgi:hypothetical protein
MTGKRKDVVIDAFQNHPISPANAGAQVEPGALEILGSA